MKRTVIIIIALSLPWLTAFANCDLTRYHWDCDITLHIKPTREAHSLVYCGGTYGYITKAEYDVLARYHRANVNMSLAVNNDYVDGPCIPSGR